MIRRPVVFVVLALLGLASCGDGDTDLRRSSTTTASTGGGEGAGALPYFLFNADGWTLDGGASSGPHIKASSLGLKWSAAYTSRPEPNHEVGAALAVLDPPNGGAREFVALGATASGVREVTIGSHPAFAGEERNVDGALIASHIAWDSGNYVVAFTVYETGADAALKLAKDIASVSKQEWDAAMNAAAAD